jgi:hypothetical protein
MSEEKPKSGRDSEQRRCSALGMQASFHFLCERLLYWRGRLAGCAIGCGVRGVRGGRGLREFCCAGGGFCEAVRGQCAGWNCASDREELSFVRRSLCTLPTARRLPANSMDPSVRQSAALRMTMGTKTARPRLSPSSIHVDPRQSVVDEVLFSVSSAVKSADGW